MWDPQEFSDETLNAVARLAAGTSADARAAVQKCKAVTEELFAAVQELITSMDPPPEDSDAPFVPKLFVRKMYDDGIPMSPINCPLDVSTAIRVRDRELRTRDLPGIDINEQRQLEWLEQLSETFCAVPIPWPRKPTPEEEAKAIEEDDDEEPRVVDHGLHFHYENQSYSYLDAQLLAAIIMRHRPKRILAFVDEFQYAAFLDILDRAKLHDECSCVFIEPDPDRLEERVGLPPAGASHKIICGTLQNLDKSRFDELSDGDLLFTDTTHVAKAASDVCHLISRVLPALAPGVLVHLHDVFWPFEYPPGWLTEGRSWNEVYMLRAFLQFNAGFEVALFNNYLIQFCESKLHQLFPDSERNSGGALWVRRLSNSK